MKANVTMLAVVLMGLLLAQQGQAGAIASINNTDDGIAVDGSRSGWTKLSAFKPDASREAGIGNFDVDWNRVTVANASDLATFFIRYELNNGADFKNFPAFYNIFIDADQNRATGYIGDGSQLPIGADYLIQGANVFSFSGGSVQTAFGWTLIMALTADNSFTNRDICLAVPARVIGNPSTFHFVLHGDNALSGNTPDYYPDGGSKGADGDYFEYTTKAGGSSVPGENR